MFKVILKYFLRLVLLLFTVTIGYFVLALILSLISTSPKDIPCQKNNDIFVSTNGIHLDIILTKEKLPIEFQQNLALGNNVKYVAFGWGDKGFYLETPTWEDLKFSTAINAMFLKSEAVMHVTKYRIRYNHWQSVPICDYQLKPILEHIQSSFTKDASGKIEEIPNAGYTRFDTFYEANGSYNLINTCNSWVNRALKAANIKTSIWSPFDKGILYQLQ